MRMLTVFFFAGMLAGVSPDPPLRPPPQHCFSPQQLDGWRAVDTKTLYIRADVNHYYRIDLARECPLLASGDAQLILNLQGSTICSAANVLLKASEPFIGIPEPCFVKQMTELSPAETASIPPSQRP